MRALSILVLAFLVVAHISVSFCSDNSSVSCIESEKQALMRFKQDLIDPSNRLASWSNDGDCCMWAGIVCDNLTGHVHGIHLRNPIDYEPFQYLTTVAEDIAYERSKLSGKVSHSLLNLKHLSYLDLSYNNFGRIQIPEFFGSMRSLRYLNLSNAGFGGMIPHQLGNLSNLHYLNLQCSIQVYSLNVESFRWLSGLSSLQHLDMSGVNLSKASDWLQVTNTLPCLVELHLSYCQLQNFHLPHNVSFSSLSRLDLSNNYYGDSLFSRWVFGLNKLVSLDLSSNSFQGSIPSGLQNITSLKYLDLSDNHFNSSIPNWLYGFPNLESLDLGANNLQGKISSAIGNLTSAISLDLSGNELEGGIPRSLRNLCNLRSISVSGVNLSQELSEVLDNLLGCVSNGLESLDLGYTQCSGQLTDQLGQFKKLTQLDLSRNLISGPIPVSIGKLSSLRELSLFDNKLNGTLPECFGQFSKLEILYIFNNLLNGVVSEAHFANLTRLKVLYASGNSLILRVSPLWVPPFLVVGLRLRSWDLGPRFPLWLHSQKNVSFLDVSNTSISSTIPNWFWNMSSQFRFMNLSHNQLVGQIPDISRTAYYLRGIDLNSNQFEGRLPRLPFNMTTLDLSNNLLSGSISHFLCYQINEPKRLSVLNLEGNHLSGELPDCWMGWQRLEVINLSNNSFTGNIPNSMGTLSYLESLHLRDNRLFGELPWSLSNCTNLVTIDFGENELIGSIPSWIGELSYLTILNLRSNKFHGHIPDELCAMTFLQILDLAKNDLSGVIPRCVNNFSAMVTNYSSQFLDFGSFIGMEDDISDDASVVKKGQIMAYSTILRYVKVLDLSDNKLSGEVPTEVTSLVALQSLNLSNNLLTGRIPRNIGTMDSLESLDLSANQLSGEIPPSMSSLTFLGFLNLSHNNLRGKIPSSTQLQSFDASSFTGNQLCGPPLTENCSANGTIPNTESGGGNADDGLQVWFYASVALGFVVGFWGAVGSLLLNRPWRIMFFSSSTVCGSYFGGSSVNVTRF